MVLRTNFRFLNDAVNRAPALRKLPSRSPQRNTSKNAAKPSHRPALAATLPRKPANVRPLPAEEKQAPALFLSSKNSTPKNADQRTTKSAKHRRFLSLADRPLSHNMLRRPEPEKTNKRKFSLEARSDIPVVVKYAHYTQTGFIPGNNAKVNQDSFFEHVNFAGYPDLYLFGVCDGHGFYGAEVSGYVKQRLPVLLSQNQSLYSNPKKALSTEILRCSAELAQTNIDVNFSGTTLITVLIKGSSLYCANVGDSRALVARQINDAANNTSSGRHWMSIALSRDHKPDDKAESIRIQQCNGRVESYQDENGNPVGPARVWLKDQDLPGLAMSRSLGDAVAASVGVIPEPEILEFLLTAEDKFIVIGSDGVFEFLSNEEVVKIVVPHWKIRDAEGSCEALWREANLRWKSVRNI
jgi:serine/threonine protein phosphatase PrpC